MFNKKDKMKSLNDKLLEKASGGNKDPELLEGENNGDEGSEKALIGAAAAANPPEPSIPIPKPGDFADTGLKKEKTKDNVFGKLISRFKS